MKTVKSVTKALKILEVFQTNRTELAFGEIVKSLNLDKATVYRLTFTLMKEGFLRQEKKRGKYLLGRKFINIVDSNFHAFKIENTTIPYELVNLSRSVNEPVSFTVWDGSEILSSRSFMNGKSLNTSIDWEIGILHQACIGKIFLANMSDEDLNRYFRKKVILKNTTNSNFDIKKIKKQLAVIKRKGIAFEDEENYPGLTGLAAGVKNSDGETMGAVYIMGPTIRLTHAVLEKIAPGVRLCAVNISAELGYRT